MCPHLHCRLGVDLVSEHQTTNLRGQEFESLCAGRPARSSRWKSDTMKE